MENLTDLRIPFPEQLQEKQNYGYPFRFVRFFPTGSSVIILFRNKNENFPNILLSVFENLLLLLLIKLQKRNSN